MLMTQIYAVSLRSRNARWKTSSSQRPRLRRMSFGSESHRLHHVQRCRLSGTTL